MTTRRENGRNLALVACLAAGMCGAAFGADWPCFRGPTRDGISPDRGWVPAALSAGPKVAWQAKLGKGYSSMTIADGRVYSMGLNDGENAVVCLEEKTGRELWRRGVKGGGEPASTPVVDGKLVYAVTRDAMLLCVDAATGELKWQKDLKADFDAKTAPWGDCTSPCIEGDLVILNFCRSGIALNKATGEKVWASEPGAGNNATAVVFSNTGTPYAAIFGLDTINVVELKTGRRLFSCPWETAHGVNVADPIVSGGKIFITSGYGRGCGLVDFSGKLLWDKKVLASHFSSCVLHDGHVFGVHGNAGGGDLRCVGFETGEQKWSQGLGFGSLIMVDGKLIMLNENGKVHIAEADTGSYRELAQAQVLEGQCWTSPAFANGRLYCRNTPGDLVCVDLTK